MEGGPPTGSETAETHTVEAVVDSINEILDTGRLKFESRQATFALDPFQTKVLRDKCPPERRRDRAAQRTYATDAFVVTIPHTGNAQITLKDWRSWDKSFGGWMQRAGLSKASSNAVLKQVWNQIPGGTTRAEIPVLEQAMKRLKVECDVHTYLKKTEQIYAEVHSNINYSMNEVGLEYFGTTRWVDAIIRVLIGLQHTTFVSEASRDKFIEDVFQALEEKRKQREKEEQEAKEKKGADYYV